MPATQRPAVSDESRDLRTGETSPAFGNDFTPLRALSQTRDAALISMSVSELPRLLGDSPLPPLEAASDVFKPLMSQHHYPAAPAQPGTPPYTVVGDDCLTR